MMINEERKKKGSTMYVVLFFVPLLFHVLRNIQSLDSKQGVFERKCWTAFKNYKLFLCCALFT